MVLRDNLSLLCNLTVTTNVTTIMEATQESEQSKPGFYTNQVIIKVYFLNISFLGTRIDFTLKLLKNIYF